MVGDKTVSATVNLVAITQTATVTVTPLTEASASQSSVASTPGAIAASGGETTSTITVTARDQLNNPIPGATVLLASTGTGNNITQPAAVTDANGVATGTISSTVAQTKTLSATINGVAITQTAGVTVTPAAAAQLVFTTQPAAQVLGSPITPAMVVVVRDAFGNTVTGFAGTITMTIENDASLPGDPAALSGTTEVTVANGTATFADLQIDQLGIGYTLEATAGSLSVISAAFTVLVIT